MFELCDMWPVSAFVHQMFRIISLFVVVCSVDKVQMSGMGMAFIKALSCLSLQTTGCRSSVHLIVTTLSSLLLCI